MQKTTPKPTRKSYGVSVYCRQQKIRRDGRAPVEVTVSVNGEKAMFQLTEAWVPSEFSKMREMKRQNEVRQLCSEVTTKMGSLHERYPEASAKTLKQYYLSGPPSVVSKMPTVSILCKSYLENVKKGRPSYDKYRVTFDRFCNYHGYGCERANDISSGDVWSFLEDLRQSGLAEGTCRNYYKRLKSLFTYGFEKRAVTMHPFSGFKMTFKDPDPVYLTKEELDAIKQVELPPYLDRVREIFLFLCGTGIEWADLEGLSPEDVQEQDGLRFIQKRRVKTGEPYRAYLIGDAPSIWDKYRGVLPLISNQKENKYIKKVVEQTGGTKGGIKVTKKVTTLTARHTYATALLSGSFGPSISIDALKRVLGHAKMDQSLRYATLLDKSLDKAFEGYKQ